MQARQSRINYTVVNDSAYMEYFVNMAGAEEELYNKWKELTLNSSANPSKYRVVHQLRWLGLVENVLGCSTILLVQ